MHSTFILTISLLASPIVGKVIPRQNGGLTILSDFHDPPENGTLHILPNHDDHGEIVPFPFEDTPENVLQLSKAFELIENIPDLTLDAGTDAVMIWTQATGKSLTGALLEEPFKIDPKKIIKIAKCVGEIAILIQKGSLTIQELKDIKDLVKKLGGAKKVAELLLKAKNWEQLQKLGGPLLKELGDYLKEWKTTIKDCFSFK